MKAILIVENDTVIHELLVPNGEVDYWGSVIGRWGGETIEPQDNSHVPFYPAKIPPDMATIQCLNRFYPQAEVKWLVDNSYVLEACVTLSQHPKHFQYWYKNSTMEWLKRCKHCAGDYDMLENLGYKPAEKVYIHLEGCPAIRTTGL
jgi:hypothetical protein